jgi:hypothetical protein
MHYLKSEFTDRVSPDSPQQLRAADRIESLPDAPVGRYGQHVTQAVATDGGAQLRVGSIDLVAGHPRRRDLRLNGAGDQLSREGGFGCETPS